MRDEEGKISLYSPKELITGDVQLFRRSEIEVRSGDLLRYTSTNREHGMTGNQRFTVESVSDTGDIRLRGDKGAITINPGDVRAQQHIDYAWAVTGYGAQGTSSDYVISLEGVDEGRQVLATRRAFYISASRVKEHVQIYTDGKADWVKAVTRPERDAKTAHDVLQPETQRQQARAIWAMGQPLTKTAIGRAWVRHQGMGESSVTGRIIPATRRFPEPALALPVYDKNGKSTGLALVSLVASPEGRLTQGDTRMVVTERASGAVLQRSQSGNTRVASDLGEALNAVREHPKDGVIWQTGTETPSASLIRITGGIVPEAEQNAVQGVSRLDAEIVLPDSERLRQKDDVAPDIGDVKEQDQALRQAEEQLAARTGKRESGGKELQSENIIIAVEESLNIKPETFNSEEREGPAEPTVKTIRQIAAGDGHAEVDATMMLHKEQHPGIEKGAAERTSRVVNELANSERDMTRQPDNVERGRTPEREEQTITRTIQKER